MEAEVTEVTRGGLIVRVLGFRAFLPTSQVAAELADDWKGLVGRHVLVELLEVNRRWNRVIVRQVGAPAAPP